MIGAESSPEEIGADAIEEGQGVVGWQIAVIAVGAILFALLVIGLVALFLRKRNRDAASAGAGAGAAATADAPSLSGGSEYQNLAVAPPLTTSEYAAVALPGTAPLTANQYGAARGEYGIAPPFATGDNGAATGSMRGTGTYGMAPQFTTGEGVYDVAPGGTGSYGVVEPFDTGSNPYEATGAPLVR